MGSERNKMEEFIAGRSASRPLKLFRRPLAEVNGNVTFALILIFRGLVKNKEAKKKLK